MSKSVIITDGFFDKAKQMRSRFEECFADAAAPSGERFIWDYWHLRDRYTHLRTPAYDFFPRSLYEDFHQQLVWWGRRNLGCHDISPTWLSCYVDGCEQRLHADLPHGPWAFVFSLTPWAKRKFSGGETLLLRDSMLDYWRGHGGRRGLEEHEVFDAISPKFNRLVVFDPRIPHGVRRVEGGVRDVCEGRLVVHGWFVNPRPFVEGPLSVSALSEVVGELTHSFGELFSHTGPVSGVLSVSFGVSAAGKTGDIRVLTNSLRSLSGETSDERAVLAHVREFIGRAGFRRARKASRVTLPLLFDSGEDA